MQEQDRTLVSSAKELVNKSVPWMKPMLRPVARLSLEGMIVYLGLFNIVDALKDGTGLCLSHN